MFLAKVGSIASSKTGSAFDSDAQAFFTATGISDGTIKSAVNTLVVTAKANGWWTLCNAIYPMVGGTATTHKYNLKDPQDTNGAFRLVFTGGWTHSSTGALPNGTTGYADTNLNASTVLSATSNHMSYYSRTNTSGVNSYDLGGSSATELLLLVAERSNGPESWYESGDSYVTLNAGALSKAAYWLGSRTAAGTGSGMAFYRNGSSVGGQLANGSAATLPSVNLYLSAQNVNGTVGRWCARECAFASIGAGISGALQGTMYTDIQTFQTSLSRQV